MITLSDTQQLYQAIQQNLSISMIMTPREELVTCRDTETIGKIGPNCLVYSFLPVVDDKENFIGLFDTRKKHEDNALSVRECYTPITEDWIIGNGAKVFDFIAVCEARRAKFVVSETGIDGLVTVSDLIKEPVRMSSFALILELEDLTSRAIRQHYPEDQWLKDVAPKRSAEIMSRYDQARSDDFYTTLIDFTSLTDKLNILRQFFNPYPSKTSFNEKKQRIIALRNQIAHNRQIPDSERDIDKFISSIKAISDLKNGLFEVVNSLSDAS